MANPQKENGYTSIANEIMEKLSSYRISGEEWQILCVILRQTYGWQKKEDHISITQFCLKTQMKRASVYRAIKKLSTKKLIICSKNANSYINLYRFNKDFDTWATIYKKATTIYKRATPLSTKELTKLLAKELPTIQQTMDTKQSARPTVAADSNHKEIVEVIEAFKEINPSYEQLFKNKTQRGAADRLLKKNGLTKVKEWVEGLKITNSLPYAPIVITPHELERKIGALKAFVEKSKN